MIILCFASSQSFGNGSPLNVFSTASPDLFEGEKKTQDKTVFFSRKKSKQTESMDDGGLPKAMPPSELFSWDFFTFVPLFLKV